MQYNCLVVDDEQDLADMTCEYFRMFDVTCVSAGTGAECLTLLAEHTVDLLLLDINLERESGFWLCKKIRETSDIPILFISARQSDEDILTALTIGGDDYVKKPYSLSILLAKVKAMLKRLGSGSGVVTGDAREKILLDESNWKVRLGSREVQLKAKEFQLLRCLFEHRDTIVTKESLFDEVWGDSYFSDGALNVQIRRLREKIEENPNEPRLIRTVWGTGYLLKTEGES